MALGVDDPARCHAENNPRSRTPSAGDSKGTRLGFQCKSGGYLISGGGGLPPSGLAMTRSGFTRSRPMASLHFRSFCPRSLM